MVVVAVVALDPSCHVIRRHHGFWQLSTPFTYSSLVAIVIVVAMW
jgi:hypothetical protein